MKTDAKQLGMLPIAEWATASGLGVFSSWRDACKIMQNLFLETGALNGLYCKKTLKNLKNFPALWQDTKCDGRTVMKA